MKKFLLVALLILMTVTPMASAAENQGGYCRADGTCYDANGQQMQK